MWEEHLKLFLKKSDTWKFEQPGFFGVCCISSDPKLLFLTALVILPTLNATSLIGLECRPTPIKLQTLSWSFVQRAVSIQ